MTQVLRQRQWRMTLSLVTMVIWVLGTNFCALGLMARPCADATPVVSGCPHCPAEQPTPAVPAPCCQQVRAEMPPAVVTALPSLVPVVLPTDWAGVFASALARAPETDSVGRVLPDTGPPEAGQTAMRVLLGRCVPVHAPPALG